jgi:hypothetical protein
VKTGSGKRATSSAAWIGISQLAAEGSFLVAEGGYDGILLGEAERSATRARTAYRKRNTQLEAGAAAASILCAAAATEARLSEFLAHWEFAFGDLPSDLSSIRRIQNAATQWSRLLAYCAPSFRPGSSVEYLALGCLMRMRDHLAHRHARLLNVGAFPSGLEACVRQGAIPIRSQQSFDWISQMLVHEVATWSARTAARWLEHVDEIAPIHC